MNDTLDTITNLIHVHSGNMYPTYLVDTLFQSILINGNNIEIHVILPYKFINVIEKSLQDIDWELYCNFNATKCVYKLYDNIPVNISFYSLEDFDIECLIIDNTLAEFRDGFWIHALKRFHILKEFSELYNITNFFHIENDVLMYTSFDRIIKSLDNSNIPCMVQDSPARVIPSIVYFPSLESIRNLTSFIKYKTSMKFQNDMEILGLFEEKFKLPFIPLSQTSNKIIFDGAAIGQYLGGIDSRNINCPCPIECYHKTRSFINETCVFKCSDYEFNRKYVKTNYANVPINIWITNKPKCYDYSIIANLHVHSKQLFQFSSIFNIEYNNIISGDRVLSLCDYIFTTPDIMKFHLNCEKYVNGIITVHDFNNIDYSKMNHAFEILGKKTCRIFVYTHLLKLFQEKILGQLDSRFKYILYTGNSDDCFDNSFNQIINSPKISRIYAQNIGVQSKKLNILPIGMANSMWVHGNVKELYSVASKNYLKKKSKAVYLNINTSTFPYRKTILDAFSKYYTCSASMPYTEYLQELSQCMFCICPRGNGLDTHRFWEALYLGVVPVVVNNKYTDSKVYTKYLRELNVPFYEITDDMLDIDYMNVFTRELYESFIKDKSSLYNLTQLDIKYYT